PNPERQQRCRQCCEVDRMPVEKICDRHSDNRSGGTWSEGRKAASEPGRDEDSRTGQGNSGSAAILAHLKVWLAIIVVMLRLLLLLRHRTAGNHIFIRRPIPQIDEPAALATEREFRSAQDDFLFTDRTLHTPA